MKKAKWLVGLLALALVVGLVGLLAVACGEETAEEATTTTVEPVADTGQTFELDFSYGTPKLASLTPTFLDPWCTAIADATDGRVTVIQHDSGSLASDAMQYDAIRTGIADISLIEPEYVTGTFPITELGSLPMLFPNPAIATAVMWDIIDEYAQSEWSQVKVLGVTCIAGAQYIGNGKVALPTDLAGKKMRSGGKVETWILDELGAESSEIELADIPTAMQTGAADGAFLSWSLAVTSGAYDLTTDRTELNLMYRPWVIAMRMETWNSLPQTLQDAILSVSTKEINVAYNIANEVKTNEAREYLENVLDKKNNLAPIYEPTQAELDAWKTAVEPVWQMWVADLAASNSPNKDKGQEILDRIEELVEQYTAQMAALTGGAAASE